MTDPHDYFTAARRGQAFSEAQPAQGAEEPEPQAKARQESKASGSLGARFRTATQVVGPPRPEEPVKGLLRVGYKKAYAAYEAELKVWRRAQSAEIIRSGVLPRPTMVTVMNGKGGAGKSPTTALTAAAIAQERHGGEVAVWEATDEQGTLLHRSEGNASRGLVEMLEAAMAGELTTTAALKSFGVPQSSGSMVFGSVEDRRQFSSSDIELLYEVIGAHYPISIVDSANMRRSGAFTAAVGLTDVVVIPSVISFDALRGALDMIEAVTERDKHRMIPYRPELGSRILCVLTHDGGDEHADAFKTAVAILEEADVPWVEVPFDPHIREGQVITYSKLSDESKDAWREVAARVTEMLVQAVVE